MKNILTIFTLSILILGGSFLAFAQNREDIDPVDVASGAIFDDKTLLDGYAEKYQEEEKETLLAMIADDSLGAYKCAAAVRVFKDKYAEEVLSNEKINIIKILIRRLNRSDSPFVQVEIMNILVLLDRYQFFITMVPSLILKMDHYNSMVSVLAYEYLKDLTGKSVQSREARIVINTLRKVFFLTRNKIKKLETPDIRMRQKLDLLRWSVKILGTQELKRLPSEVINLL